MDEIDKMFESVKKLSFFELQTLKDMVTHKLAERVNQLASDNVAQFSGPVEHEELKHVTLTRACRILADKGLVIKLESAK